MFDPREPTLNRVGGGFGTLGNAILTITDLVPGVGAIEKKLGLKLIDRTVKVALEKGGKEAAENLLEKAAKETASQALKAKATEQLTEEGTKAAKLAAEKKTAEGASEQAAKVGKKGAGEAGEYADTGGHHVHAKSAFKGNVEYDPKKGFSISQEYMKSRKMGSSGDDQQAAGALHAACEERKTQYSC